jgi:hypothetical protein
VRAAHPGVGYHFEGGATNFDPVTATFRCGIFAGGEYIAMPAMCAMASCGTTPLANPMRRYHNEAQAPAHVAECAMCARLTNLFFGFCDLPKRLICGSKRLSLRGIADDTLQASPPARVRLQIAKCLRRDLTALSIGVIRKQSEHTPVEGRVARAHLWTGRHGREGKRNSFEPARAQSPDFPARLRDLS